MVAIDVDYAGLSCSPDDRADAARRWRAQCVLARYDTGDYGCFGVLSMLLPARCRHHPRHAPASFLADSAVMMSMGWSWLMVAADILPLVYRWLRWPAPPFRYRVSALSISI